MSRKDSSPPEDGDVPPPEGAGERLRASREEQGLRVETVVDALGLSRSVVLALEADDYEALGAPVYVRGYLRKYARFLGIPDDEIVAAYEEVSSPRDPELKSLAPKTIRTASGRWIAPVVTFVVVVIIVIVAWWAWNYLLRGQQTGQVPPSAAASASPAFEQSGFPELAPGATSTVNVTASAGSSQHTGVASAGSANQAGVVPPVLPGTAAMATNAKPASSKPAVPSDSGKHKLILRIRDTSWVEVMAADHTRLYYDLAPAGKTLEFNARHGALTVSLGNARGVKVRVNGEPFSIPSSDRSGNTARFKIKLNQPTSGADKQ
jgi:cytoskeleton protein RodZ